MKKIMATKRLVVKHITPIVNKISNRIKDLFELEEVEVTFDDKKSHYTYTKVSHN